MKSLSCVRLLATPWTAAYQAPPSMGFSRQEYWSGVSLPSPLLQCRQTLYRLSHETQPRQHIKKQRHYLPTKVCLVKAMVFPVVMYGCESWTVNKAEFQRTDAFELWCWRRLLRVPWTARRSKQSILKEISPEYSLEELMLKLTLQYFGQQMRRTDLLERP